MTVNGNTKVYGVPTVGGAQGFGGHIASNGNILVNGTNTINGDATPGPGMTVTVNGNQNQVLGSRTPAASTLPCEEVSVSSWATWASTNNNNAAIPSTYFNTSSRNFTLNGNKTCTLPAGTYYVNNFTCNGNAKFIASGPCIIVTTGVLTINGGCEVNKTGDPGNLFFLLTTSAAVTLNGTAKIDLKVYAPLSTINLNGTVNGHGNLWGKVFTGNGSVVWNRLKDTGAPSIAITQPATGSTVPQAQPSIAIAFSDGTGGSGLNLQSLMVQLDGVSVTNSLTVTATGATGAAPSALTDGSHTLTASISDYDGNTASATSEFNVQTVADQEPPVITVTGIEENGLYSAPVNPLITVTDPNLDAPSVVITLDGLAYASGTPVSAEGSHTLHVAASDTFSNHAEKDVHFTLAFDHQGPAITITGVTDGSWYNQDVSAQVSVTDDHLDPASVQITLNGQAYVSGTPVTTDGYYTLYVTAADTGGNASQAAVSFALDKTAPQISVTSPADNATVNASPVTLTGYVSDASPDTLTVNGQAVGSPGQSSFSTPVALAEGANTIALAATDRAGNGGSLTWHVTLKTSAPTVTIASPIEGLVTRSSSIGVTGTASTDAVSVTVNGKIASLAGGSFSASAVPLAEGANTLTATARDAAGNAGAASVHVTRDSQAPAISVSAPSNNSHTSEESVTVSGAIADASAVTATLNGSPLALSGAAFSSSVTLASGTNLIRIGATDTPGNASERTITVTRDTGSFTVTGIAPVNASTGVSSTASIEVTFSRSVKSTTVTAGAFTVTSGQAIPGALTVADNRVTFLPASAYPENAQVQVALTAGITDLSGTPLAPFSSTFTTLGAQQTGLTLSLDAVPSLVNHSPVTVTGRTSAGAEVAFTRTGVSAPLTAIADAQGVFSAELPLTPDTQNLFTAQASLSGQQSPAVPFAIYHDGTKPFVLAFTPGADLAVDFNEAVAEGSVTDQSVVLTVSGQSAAYTKSLELSGTRLVITPSAAIGGSPAILTVTTGVADLAGNPLREAFTKSFNGASAGDAFLVGEAYDDTTGLPLPGVSVVLESRTGVSAPHSSSGGQTLLSAQTSSGSMGAWALSVPSGNVAVHLSASGYSDAYRTASVPSGEIHAALDARLKALSTQTQILGAAGGTATFAGGSITLTAPSGAFAEDATLAVTSLSGQGLPLPLPAGFSPWAAFRVDASAAPTSALTLSVARTLLPAQAPADAIPAAFLDRENVQWVGLAPANNDGTRVNLSFWRTGVSALQVVVLLRPDESPSPPPAVQDGHALEGVSAPALDSATATLTADPASIPPDGKATATVAITPSSAAPSSLPFAVTFTESLDVREGSTTATKRFSPYTADFTAYQDPAAPASHEVAFPVSPFPGIDVLTLLSGKIELAAGPYWEGNLGGGIVGPTGGSVDGSGGTHVSVPASATPVALPVRIFPVASSSLLAAIPQGFAYVGGIELSLGGGTLTLPATLSLDQTSLAQSVTSSDTVLLVKAATVGGVATYLLVDFGVLDGDRLETCSGAGYPSALSALPWTTVKEEGRYVFLKATAPIAFATGRVTDGTVPLGNALAGFLPAEQSSGGGAGKEGARERESAGAREKSAASTQSSVLSPQSLKSRVAGLAKDGKAPKAAESLVELTGINFVTGSDGRYAVPATLGSRQVKAVHLLTADEGTASVSLTQANAAVPLDVAIQAAPLGVVTTYPANNAQNVPSAAEITITFSKLLDPASVTAGHVQVTAGGSALTGQLRIVTGGTTLAFTPDAPFAGGAAVSVTVSGVADRLGRVLASPYTFSFSTQVLSPPHLDPGKIEARLPNAQGQICVAGGPGAVEGQAVVYLLNATHYAYGTVTATANNDGSFNLCFQGAIGDTIELHVIGNDGTERVYTFSQLVSDDHQTVALGPSGGVFTSKNADGTPIATIQVPPGAFDGFGTIAVKPADPAQAAPTPAGFEATAPIQITLSTTAKKEIELVLPVPASWNLNDPQKQFWLVSTVTWGPNDTKSPMVLDTMRPTGCTNGSGNCLVTNSPPFPGIVASSMVQGFAASMAWGFFAGTLLQDTMPSSLVVACSDTPFVFLLSDLIPGVQWVLAVPAAAPPGGYTLTFSDAATGEVFTTVTRTDPPNPGTPTDIGIVTNVPTRAYLMDASPFKAFAFQLKAVPLASGDPMLSAQLAYASSPALTIAAGPGTAAPGDAQSPSVATVTSGGATVTAPVLSDGSFTAVFTSLTSGTPVSVTYPAASGTTPPPSDFAIPALDVTDKLALRLEAGRLRLKAQPGFAEAGAYFFLYTAMGAAASMGVPGASPIPADNLDVDLSAGSFSVNDVLFYTLAKNDVDASDPISVTFDSALAAAPAADWGTETPAAPVVRLVDIADEAHPLPISLSFTPSGNAPRQIAVHPLAGLEPGATYELRLYNLANAAGLSWPQGAPVTGRFTAYGATDIGATPYDEVFDMARRGAILYAALGDQGFDIVDASDPTSPLSLVNGPLPQAEKMRSVAIAENVLVPEEGQNNARTVMALVGAAGQQGTIRVYYADPVEDAQDQTPPQTASVGTHISGANLCAVGTPSMVRTLGTTAFVSTTGVGLQQVDLSAVAQRHTDAVRFTVGSYQSKDISMSIKGLAVVPPAATGAGAFVVAAVVNQGLYAWKVSELAPAQAGTIGFPDCPKPTGALRMQVFPNLSFTHVAPDGTRAPMTKNLILVAGGSAGLLVYGYTAGPSSLNLELLSVIPTASPVYDVAMDARRMIAYAATYTSGVTVIDLSDPVSDPALPSCQDWQAQHPGNLYGLLDRNDDGADDRIVGTLPSQPGANATLVVDSETGLLYVGVQGAGSGVHVIGAREPRMEFVLDDPANPGRYKIPGYLSSFDGDKPRLALWLPGGAGSVLQSTPQNPITIQLYNRSGLEETPAQDANGANVVSTVYRTVNLYRQSNKRTEGKYNFYLQTQPPSPAPPDPNQDVQLAMTYDASVGTLTSLLVSKQSGSLRGTALPHGSNGWNGWAQTVSVEKPVSRPWVEWGGFVAQTNHEAHRELSVTISGDRVFFMNRQRNFTVNVYPFNFLPTTLNCSVTLGALGGQTLIPLPPFTPVVRPRLSYTAPLLPQPNQEVNLVFEVGTKKIGEIPIKVVSSNLLGAMKVSHNADSVEGELDQAKKLAPGAFLPVNNDDDDYLNYDWKQNQRSDLDLEKPITGEDDLLHLVLHPVSTEGKAGNYMLRVVDNAVPLIKFWRSADKTGKVDITATSFPADRTTHLYAEGLNMGSCHIQLDWTDGLDSVPVLDQVKLSVFEWIGPLNVPEHSVYRYTTSGALPESMWSPPIFGDIQSGAGTSDITVLWQNEQGDPGSGYVGKAIYQVNPDYVWDLPVNVVRFSFFTNNIVYSSNVSQYEGDSSGKTLIANYLPYGAPIGSKLPCLRGEIMCQISGPQRNGSEVGINAIQAGWVQIVQATQTHTDYMKNGQPSYRRKSSLEDGMWHLDGQEGVAPPWYAPETQVSPGSLFENSGRGGLIGFHFTDNPAKSVTDQMVITADPGGTYNASYFALLEDFKVYLAARTREIRNDAHNVYTQLARAEWHFDGKGFIAGGIWAPDTTPGVAGSGAYLRIVSGVQVPLIDGIENWNDVMHITRMNALARGETWVTIPIP